ncbi:MAG: YicC/YloC family endoribonuclease, partial [Eubacteriales bacterium]
KGEATSLGRAITVEVRSVNNRYIDCTVRVPRHYLFLEETLKKTVQTQLSRGKVDIFVTIDQHIEEAEISINHPLIEAYCDAFDTLAKQYHLENDITLSRLITLPDLLHAEKPEEDSEAMGAEILVATQKAVANLSAMQRHEGEKLKEDILNRKKTIQEMLEFIEKRSPETVELYQAKLHTRITELLGNTELDPSRILTEVAIFADKTAVDEETVRLHSHLGQLEEILAEGGAVGRKLDFLIQELNREINTIGSKTNDLELTRQVVQLKSEIEKIREQVQNIE